ncbi:unnamed protein product [Urochloa humidicola]
MNEAKEELCKPLCLPTLTIPAEFYVQYSFNPAMIIVCFEKMFMDLLLYQQEHGHVWILGTTKLCMIKENQINIIVCAC